MCAHPTMWIRPCFLSVLHTWSPKQCLVWVLSLRVGLKSNQIFVGCSHKLSAFSALVCLLGRTLLEITGFVARLVFPFLFWWYEEYFLHQRHYHVGVEALYRHQATQLLHESCRCSLQQWTLPPCHRDKPKGWATAWIVWEFPWDSFG